MALQQATITVPVNAANRLEALHLFGLKVPGTLTSVNSIGRVNVRYQVNTDGCTVELARYGKCILGPAPTSSSNDDQIVYITKTGKDYHTDGCRYLSKSKIPLTLREAKARGYKPDHTGCNAPD